MHLISLLVANNPIMWCMQYISIQFIVPPKAIHLVLYFIASHNIPPSIPTLKSSFLLTMIKSMQNLKIWSKSGCHSHKRSLCNKLSRPPFILPWLESLKQFTCRGGALIRPRQPSLPLAPTLAFLSLIFVVLLKFTVLFFNVWLSLILLCLLLLLFDYFYLINTVINFLFFLISVWN